MKSAYNATWLNNLSVVKEAKRWHDDGIISSGDFSSIAAGYKSDFYHPNLMIRILLFVASLIALGGVTGILGLLFADIIDDAIAILLLIYGIVSLFSLEFVFIRNSNHYKSGVTEALLYHSIGFTIGGLAAISDFDVSAVTVTCILVFGFSAYRYLDLISTLAALCSFGYLLVFEMYELGEIAQQVTPIAFIAVFTPLYFLFKTLKNRNKTEPWRHCLVVSEAFSLLAVYAAGNYFVVRELSVNMMQLDLAPGNDIPLAFIFYGLTVVIPVLYLYFGIKNKDVVLLRVSLLAIAFSVFTFKYYFSLGHPEFTLTAAGIILLLITLLLFRYLKTPKHGYTRENILKEKWADANPEAFVISQTLGGNQVVVDESFKGGGGEFSGGGASGEF
jgi:hypothetical protein